MSLARQHRERVLAAKSVASAPEGGAEHVPAADFPPAAGATNATPEQRAAAQIGLRLTHDLRRLKEIKSIDMKVDAKRQMLPEYRDWLLGLLEADQGVGTGTAAEVAPTVMVWLIDVGDYDAALRIADFLMRHDVPMPSRYNRDVATVLVEEIADAAIKAQNAGEAFDLAILSRVDDLTETVDMHDEARAKLMKALGIELLLRAEDADAQEAPTALNLALTALREAHRLNDRVGVKDRIKRAEKLLAACAAAAPATEQGGDTAA
ncbi:phage terminase small subunit [Sphingobium cloacae]|uniref:Terminase n=1 Tax=Sphingobium cloacae TaxID=120107 RepID=A0A1E1F5J4_9SPHN|nr:phage terminase small subunit [Sphingobium cloacae]BAV65767.1 terminase [Sphingobium cloacae]